MNAGRKVGRRQRERKMTLIVDSTLWADHALCLGGNFGTETTRQMQSISSMKLVIFV